MKARYRPERLLGGRPAAGVGFGFVLYFGVAMVAAAQTGPSALPQSGALSGSEITRTLAGNSIVHPNFGCVFYRADGTTLQIAAGGVSQEGEWSVTGDLYHSSGACGEVGCTLSGTHPSYLFRRADGGYEQDVILILGNHCEKNGVIS